MLCHWDDVPEQLTEDRHDGAYWTDLGNGTVEIGAGRRRLPPGAQSPAAHGRDAEEALCFVVAGGGLSWQDGTTYAIRAGDALLHRPGGPAHCLVAGDEGMTAVMFSSGAGARAGEVAAEPVAVEGEPAPRPPEIVAVDDVPADERDRGEFGAALRNVGVALGTRTTGMRHAVIAPGRMNAPPHTHNAEEEMFVVLDGDGMLLLYDLDGAITDEHPVRAGHVVARPAASGVAHTFRAGDRGMTVLSYGQRKGEDVAWYPRSSKLAFRGFSGGGVLGGIVVKVDRAGFWDGEA
jgi:uncharacterized cupin superfamily protein